MRKSFDEALMDLLAEYADESFDTLISGLELQIAALREQEEAEKEEGNG